MVDTDTLREMVKEIVSLFDDQNEKLVEMQQGVGADTAPPTLVFNDQEDYDNSVEAVVNWLSGLTDGQQSFALEMVDRWKEQQ